MVGSTGIYIGLMSGTSMDAVDAVLLDLKAGQPQITAHFANEIPPSLKQKLSALSLPGDDNLDLLGDADRETGVLFAETANALMARCKLLPDQITAIGSHGQTVRHRPAGKQHPLGFTLQIGDPSTIAVMTGVTTVADFRRKDIALGGQAAPLVPAFHKAVFQHPTLNRAILNIGGIANITWLPGQNSAQPVMGFDTGPGNCLLDGWINRNLGRQFDADGNWGRSGRVVEALLDTLMRHAFLAESPPKSTGREMFNPAWLEPLLANISSPLAPEDVQATLNRFTAQSIAKGVTGLPARVDEVFICGGGIYNLLLLENLRHCLPDLPLRSTREAGIDPLHVEAAAFAWLAHRTLNNQPGSLASVTGASRDSILGGIYLPG